MEPKRIVEQIAHRLEAAWNTADGASFTAPFTPDAGSTLEYAVLQARELSEGVIVGHVRGEEHRVTAFHNTLVATG